MSHLDVDYTEVGTEMATLEPGFYDLKIVEVPEIQPSKDEKSEVLVVIMEVQTEDEEFQGRQIRDYQSTLPQWRFKQKQLFLAAGLEITPAGIDLEDLVGKIVKAEVKTTVTKDKESGDMREYTNIVRYVPVTE